jgi:hypothetical protein
MHMTRLEKACLGAKLVCDVCGKIRPLNPDRVGSYVTHGWPKHCGETMRLVAKNEVCADAIKPM